MKSDTLILAEALDALSRLYPTDAATLEESAARLRQLKTENEKLRSLIEECRPFVLASDEPKSEQLYSRLIFVA